MKTPTAKKLGITLVGALALAGINTSACATLIASEDFSYTNGDLTGNNGGTGFTTAWGNANGNVATSGTAAIQISTGTAIYNTAAVGNVSEKNPRGLATAFGSTGTLWMAFDFQRTAGPNFDGIQFLNGTSEKFLVGSLNASSFWTLGLNGSTSGGSFSTVSSSTIKTGVVRFTLAAGSAGIADLWVGSGQGAVDVSGAPSATITGLTLTGVNTIQVGSNGAQTIDNIRLGDTAADVGAVPEPTSAVLLFFGSGTMLLLRQRRAARRGRGQRILHGHEQ